MSSLSPSPSSAKADVVLFSYITKKSDNIVCFACKKGFKLGEQFRMSFVETHNNITGSKETVLKMHHLGECERQKEIQEATRTCDVLTLPPRHTGNVELRSKNIADPFAHAERIKAEQTLLWQFTEYMKAFPSIEYQMCPAWKHPGDANSVGCPSFLLFFRDPKIRIPVSMPHLLTRVEFQLHLTVFSVITVDVTNLDSNNSFSAKSVQESIAKAFKQTPATIFGHKASLTLLSIGENRIYAEVVVFSHIPEALFEPRYQAASQDVNLSFHDFQLDSPHRNPNCLSFYNMREQARSIFRNDLALIQTALATPVDSDHRGMYEITVHIRSTRSLMESNIQPMKEGGHSLVVQCNTQMLKRGQYVYIWRTETKKAEMVTLTQASREAQVEIPVVLLGEMDKYLDAECALMGLQLGEKPSISLGGIN